MAKAGNFAAYQQLRPIEDRDNLGYAEQRAFWYRREADMEKQRKKREAADWANKVGSSLSTLRAEAIGINSIDEMNAKVLLEAKGRLQQAWQKRKQNPEDLDAIMEIANLERLPEDLAMYQQKYASWANAIVKGVNEGKLSAGLNRGLIDKISSTVEDLNAVFKLDEKGSLVGAMVDPENDDVMEFKTLRDVLNGSGLERPIPIADYNASQEAIKKMYTTHTNIMDRGGTTTETVGLRDADVDGIRQNVENVWGTFNAPTDFAKSVFADRLNLSENQISPELFDKYKKDFGDEIIASFTTKTATDDGFVERQKHALAWAREQRLNKPKSSKRQDEADFLRTTIDGALAGDPKYVQSLTETLMEEDEDANPVTQAEHKNGKLILGFKDGSTQEFEEGNPESVGRLLGVVRPKDKVDVRLGLYEQGKVLVENFQAGNETGNSEIKVNALVDGLADNEGEAVKQLNSILPDQFRTEGNLFQRILNNKIKGPDGTVYDLESPADKDKLKDFLLVYEADAPENQESEDDRISRLLAEAEN